ncbi:SigE family RNA polymerase sigma factor [Nonomuraea solani]|uniref:SigE family RNA polymerase sigma factor n=1 Tax=Nonomuraea solani TaxID=1144553 RepID=UPI001F2E40A8|nr:SigE family RNA polymerase sigma factor [Nonomuraea solani]
MTVDAVDEQRFREFVAARSPALMRLGFLLTGGDQHAAEDLVQNALAKLAARWRRVETPEAYARQIMYRQQIGWWRTSVRRGEVMQASPPELADRDAHHQSELRMVLRSALARLTARQRAVLVLRYFEDLPEKEIAQVLGCSVGGSSHPGSHFFDRSFSILLALSAWQGPRSSIPTTPCRRRWSCSGSAATRRPRWPISWSAWASRGRASTRPSAASASST